MYFNLSLIPDWILYQLIIGLLCLTGAVRSIQVHEPLDSDEVTTAATTLLTSTASSTSSTAHSSSTTPFYDETTEKPASSPAIILPPINTTKMPRVVNGYQSDQQPRSTSNINTKQFVPSPQLSPMTFPSPSSANAPSTSEHARENVLPLQNVHLHYPSYANQLHIQPTYSTIPTTTTAAASPYLPNYYNRPATDNLIFGEPDRDPWRLSGASLPSPPPTFQYPITSNGGNAAAGKWYWMPNSAESISPSVVSLPVATVPSPFASDVSPPQSQPQPHWRWMFDQKYPSGGGVGGVGSSDVGPSGPEANGGYPTFHRPGTPDFQRGNEHPYSFDATPLHVYGTPKGQSPPRPFPTALAGGGLSGEEGNGIFATQISETEYHRLVKGSPAGAEQVLQLEQPLTKHKSKEYFSYSRRVLVCGV